MGPDQVSSSQCQGLSPGWSRCQRHSMLSRKTGWRQGSSSPNSRKLTDLKPCWWALSLKSEVWDMTLRLGWKNVCITLSPPKMYPCSLTPSGALTILFPLENTTMKFPVQFDWHKRWGFHQCYSETSCRSPFWGISPENQLDHFIPVSREQLAISMKSMSTSATDTKSTVIQQEGPKSDWIQRPNYSAIP